MSHLRADCLSFLHTLPHPQLNLMPQSRQLQDIGVGKKVQLHWEQSSISISQGVDEVNDFVTYILFLGEVKLSATILEQGHMMGAFT